MYRMSSNIIPLATHELLSDWKWWQDKDILKICNIIKQFVIDNDVSISFHPDQFCVINSPKKEVFDMAKDILKYHNILSNLLGNNILILHCGGVYGAKKEAIQRFINNFKTLESDIQNKIVLENDDKSFNVEEVLYICNELNIRMCVDFHHDRCLPSTNSIEHYIDDILETWNGQTPKCHISTGKETMIDRKHAEYVSDEDFKRVFEITKGKFNIMFECKCKELSVLNFTNKL